MYEPLNETPFNDLLKMIEQRPLDELISRHRRGAPRFKTER